MTISQSTKQKIHNLISLHYKDEKNPEVRLELIQLSLKDEEHYYFIADELARLKPKPQRTPDLTPFIGKFQKEIEPDVGHPREKVTRGNPTLEDDPEFLKWLRKPTKKR